MASRRAAPPLAWQFEQKGGRGRFQSEEDQVFTENDLECCAAIDAKQTTSAVDSTLHGAVTRPREMEGLRAALTEQDAVISSSETAMLPRTTGSGR